MRVLCLLLNLTIHSKPPPSYGLFTFHLLPPLQLLQAAALRQTTILVVIGCFHCPTTYVVIITKLYMTFQKKKLILNKTQHLKKNRTQKISFSEHNNVSENILFKDM